MKLRIESAARNALTLVARRYEVRREAIVEIAPLLFFIAAEQCFHERQKRLADVRASADALFHLQSGIHHLPPYYPDEIAFRSEEQSIKARDLFGREVTGDLDADYKEAEQNPFAAFLRDSLARVSKSPELVEWTSWAPGLSPSYAICWDEAAELVGGDEDAALAILDGWASLHEMPKGTPEQRAEWARAKAPLRVATTDLRAEDLI